ncbi:hypothetical protein D3C81_1328300 [compost metagenome]
MSISSSTIRIDTALAVSPAITLGGSISSQRLAVRNSRQSAASSLASSWSLAMASGVSSASVFNCSTPLPSRSANLPGSCSMSDSRLMPSHTPSIAAQLPASKPLPTAAEVDCDHRGLNSSHSLRSQVSSD